MMKTTGYIQKNDFKAKQAESTGKDETLIHPVKEFTGARAHGLVQNGKAIQVIVGLSVPQVRERFEALLEAAATVSPDEAATKSATLKAFTEGKIVPIEEVPDEAFSSKVMGDGIAIMPEKGVISAPAAGVTTIATF